MTFRKCFLIALFIHVAMVAIPIDIGIEAKKKISVELVISNAPATTGEEKAEVKPAETATPPVPIFREIRKSQKSKEIPRDVHVEKVAQVPEKITPPQVVVKKIQREPLPEAQPVKNERVPVKKTAVQHTTAKKTRKNRAKQDVPLSQEVHSPVARSTKPTISPPGSVAEDGEDKVVNFGSREGPQFLRRVVPRYPLKAKRLRKEAMVVLMLTLNKTGALINVEVIRKAGYGFDESALEAVKKSSFTPAFMNETPVSCKAVLPVRFTLR